MRKTELDCAASGAWAFKFLNSAGQINAGYCLIWRRDCARTIQIAFSPRFSQARIGEESRGFAEKGNEIYAEA